LLAAGADPNVADDNGVTPLMLATDVEMARRLLDGGADVDARDQTGCTALLIAAANRRRDATLVALLLDRGADVTVSRNGGMNSLMMAVGKDRADIMMLFLRLPGVSAAYVNEQTQTGATALIVASVQGSTAAVNALIAAGADVHLPDHSGFTALHVAANAGVARLLWNAGARDARTDDGTNTLMYACRTNKPHVVEFLLQRGLDPNTLHMNKTPLMQASQLGHVDVLHVLLTANRPAEVDRRDGGGRTALFHAVMSNQPAAVRVLLSHGANIGIITNVGATILMLAVHKGFVGVVEELLQARSPTLLSARGRDGVTALLMAVQMKHPHIVDALLAAGADPNIARNDGYTPLMVAHDADMARRLLDAGADVNARLRTRDTALTLAACRYFDTDESLVALLLERGADATASRNDGCSSLLLAAMKGRMKIMKLLLAADAPADVNQQNNKGHTALFIAVSKDFPKAVQLLLDYGADPCIVDNTGSIPLMRCTSPEAVKMLVDAAPELVNHTCNRGRRALAYLTPFDICKELFASCARHNIKIDVNHADVNGDTALHMAMLGHADQSAVQLLLEKGADVFGVGYGGTTVLMKPFLANDRDVIMREYSNCSVPTIPVFPFWEIVYICQCLHTIMRSSQGMPIASALVNTVGSERTCDGVMDAGTDGGAGDEPAAKRRRQ
jgi:serine/threonine-protein phosphatase 6 regulatory ankyrin repeat subunit B